MTKPFPSYSLYLFLPSQSPNPSDSHRTRRSYPYPCPYQYTITSMFMFMSISISHDHPHTRAPIPLSLSLSLSRSSSLSPFDTFSLCALPLSSLRNLPKGLLFSHSLAFALVSRSCILLFFSLLRDDRLSSNVLPIWWLTGRVLRCGSIAINKSLSLL